MAEGFKIATGYVEIKVDYDRNKLKKAAAKAGRETGGAFETGFRREFSESLEKNFPWKKIEKSLGKTASLTGRRLGENFAESFTKRVNEKIARDVDWKNLEKVSEKASKKTGRKIGENFTEGLRESIRDVKSRDLVPVSSSKELVLASRSGRAVGRGYMNGLIQEMKSLQKPLADSVATELSDEFQKRLGTRLRGVARRANAEMDLEFAAAGKKWGTGIRRRFVAAVDGLVEDTRNSTRIAGRIGTAAAGNFATNFNTQLNANVQTNFNRVMKNLTKTGRAQGAIAGFFSAQSFSRNWNRITKSTAVSSATNFSRWFTQTHRSASQVQAASAGRRYGQIFGKAVAAALRPIILNDLDAVKVFSVVTAMMGAMGGSVGQISSIAGLLAGASSSIFVAIGRVVQFVGELSKAIGLIAALPAAMSSAIAAFGVLNMATSNFRKALFGSGEEAHNALAAISEKAPEAADSIEGIKKAAISLRDSAEDVFLKRIPKSFNLLTTKLIPKLHTGVESITDAWMDTIEKTLMFITSAEGVRGVTSIFESTATQIRNGADILPAFTEGFLALAVAGLPALEDFASWMNEITKGFRDWAVRSAEAGKVDQWIREGASALKTFGTLLGNITGIFWSILQVAGEDGMMGRLTELTGRWNEFLGTAEGTAMLRDIFDAVNQQAAALAPVFSEIGKGVLDLAPAMGSLTTAISPMAATMVRVFVDALLQITPGMVTVLEGLSKTWTDLEKSGAISMIARSIGDLFASLSPWLQVMGKAFIIVANVFALVADGISNVVGPVVAFLTRFEAVRWVLAAVVAVFMTSFLPGALAIKVAILAVSATMAVFSDKMKAVRPVILAIAGVIAAIMIPGYLALGGTAIMTGVRVVGAWVGMKIAAIKNAISTIRQMALVGIAFWQLAAAAIASGAQIVASWVRQQVAAAVSSVAQQIAAKGVARGMAAAARTALVSGAKMALGWIIGLGPIGLIIAAVAAVIGIFVLLWNKSEGFQNFMKKMWGGIKDAAAGVAAWYNSTLKPALTEIWGAVVEAMQPLIEKFQEFTEFFKGEGGSIVGQLKGAFEGIQAAIQPLGEWLANFWSEHGDTVISVVQTIAQWIGVYLVGYFKIMFSILRGAFDILVGVITGVWTAISGVIIGVLDGIMGLWKFWKGVFTGDWKGAWEGLKQTLGGVWTVISSIFVGAFEIIKGVVKGAVRIIAGVIGAFGGDAEAVFEKMWGAITGWFQKGFDWIKGILTSVRDWIIGVWDWIYNILVGNSIVPDLVNAIVMWFTNMGQWLLGIVTQARDWIVGKFQELYNRGVAIWNAIVNAIRAVFQAHVNWVRTTVTNFVANFLKKFTELRTKAHKIWTALRTAVQALVQAHVKWVISRITNFVNNVVKGFTNMRDRAKAAWNNLRDSVVTGVNNLYTRAIATLHKFRDGAIKAFERARDGIKAQWKKVEDVAKAPVKFVVNTVYNDGIRKLWNKIADKVPGLKELGRMTLPRGFAKGGILPGDSSYRQGDDQIIRARKGEGIYVSEAMRDPYEKARLFAVNKAAMQGKSLRKFRDGGFPTSAGVFPGEYTGQKKLDRRTSDNTPPAPDVAGFARGGIVGWLSDKWENIEGGIKGWATKPFNALKDQYKGKFSTGDNFEGMPYKAMSGWIEKILAKFGKEDDAFTEGGALGGKGIAAQVIRKANSYVGKVSGRPNQFTRAMGMPYEAWCAAFISEIFRMNKATGSIRGITARNGGAAVRTFNGKLRSVPHSQRQAGDLPTYRGNGHINLLANRNTTIGGNESNRVRRQTGYVNSATRILRPDYKKATGGGGQTAQAFARGGIIGSGPVGAGSHDIGGMLPDRAVAHNRSGEAEVVQTLDHLKAIVSAMEKGGDTYNINTVEINPDSIEQIKNVCDLFKSMKKSARANGGNVRYKVRD